MKRYIFLKTVTVISVLVSCGFSVIAVFRPDVLVSPALGNNRTVVVLASYAAARSIAIAVLGLFVLFGKKREPLFTVAILAALVQFLDAFVGMYEGDICKIAGPLMVALLGFISVYNAFKSPDPAHSA